MAKVKTKARKVRDTIRATGGGPAGAGLTIIEEKILDIVGSASVEGFSNLEAVIDHYFYFIQDNIGYLIFSKQVYQTS